MFNGFCITSFEEDCNFHKCWSFREIIFSRHSYNQRCYMRILIAEDNEETLQAYKDALEARNHTVTLSFDGQVCVAKYSDELSSPDSNESTSSFDVVILDYKMPRMDGLEAAKKILQINPQQRIIFAFMIRRPVKYSNKAGHNSFLFL